MSGRDLRRRVTTKRRAGNNGRTPRASPSRSPESRRRIGAAGGGKLWRPSEKVNVLKRSKSEPSLQRKTSGDEAVAVAVEEEEGVLYRPGTCTDIFSSSENIVPRSPGECSQKYNMDAKVVINVTVEGSPGPIRTMVKLGSNIEEITKLVVKRYNDEGRTPPLDKDAASTCELHHSYFSLQSLNKSDSIADVGSRSFYLRKCSNGYRSDDSKTDKTSASSNQMEISPLPFLPSFVNRKIKKMIRRTCKVWKILGCMPCSG